MIYANHRTVATLTAKAWVEFRPVHIGFVADKGELGHCVIGTLVSFVSIILPKLHNHSLILTVNNLSNVLPTSGWSI